MVESERALVRGALAYITSHETDALEPLSKIDLDTLDLRLAGQIAFARSVLVTKRDPKAAVLLLDWARLLAPGGLVEEAALRRETALLTEAGKSPRVATLTRQYATRFPASLYAADFLSRTRAPDRSNRPSGRPSELPAPVGRGGQPADRQPPRFPVDHGQGGDRQRAA